MNVGEIEKFTTISNNRDQVYTLIDTMAQDSQVSSIIKTYADCTCARNDNGHIVWCESSDPNVSKFVNYILNVMNVDKNIYGWAYCLVKYGDVYLRLYRESDYKDELFNASTVNTSYEARNPLNEDFGAPAGEELKETVNLNIHATNDKYSLYAEMVPNPGTMYELTKLGKTFGFIETPDIDMDILLGHTYMNGQELNYANYKMKSTDVNIYQADDFVHACLDSNYTRYPEKISLFTSDEDYANGTNAHSYTVKRGKSMLIDNYKVWREKSLLENAILLSRVTKSSIVRPIGVEVGDMPKEQVQQTLRRVKDLFEQKTSVKAGQSMNEYTNPGPIENNIYYATHGGQGAITISEQGGDVNVRALADLDSWINQYYAGFGVPKAYYGWTDDAAGFNGGTSLSILSDVFAKGVNHVQNALIQMITDAVSLILVNRGLKSYLNRFTIKMKPPLTAEEKDYRDDLTNRINAASNLNSLFTDIEDKARRLTILKELVGKLDYGDNIIFEIEAEIKAVKERAKKEAEEAEREAAEQRKLEAQEAANMSGGEINLGGAAAPAAEPSTEETPVEEAPVEEPAEATATAEEPVELGLSSQAPIESFNPASSNILMEAQEGIVMGDDYLPSGEEIDEKIDFTENK